MWRLYILFLKVLLWFLKDPMVCELVSHFFSRSTYCSPEVLERIKRDIVNVTTLHTFSVQLTTWGSTNQERLCMYGQLLLPLGGTQYRLPLQIWLTHQYPVDPPTLYAVAPRWGGVSSDQDEGVEGELTPQIRSRHPNVDHTGLCYCKELAAWNPRVSTLEGVVTSLAEELSANGCPLTLSRQYKRHESLGTPAFTPVDDSSGVVVALGRQSCVICFDSMPNTVFIPCGHYCCCQACASNVFSCPICRVTILLRQTIVDFQ